MRRAPAFLALLLSLSGARAAAHEAGERAVGVIEIATPTRIVLRAPDGHSVAFLVTPQTRFMEGKRSVRLEEARVGRRAVVQGRKVAGGLEAVRVRLGIMAPR